MPRAGRVAATDPNRVVDTADAKSQLLTLIEHTTIAAALKTVGRSQSAYEQWRKNDESFRLAVNEITERKANGDGRQVVPDFETFSREFLHQPLYWHQLQWVDILEGREPRGLHPSEIYEAGDPQRVMINVPPAHGKSTTITENYVTWRLLQDPTLKILIISKGLTMAKNFLHAIKQRLTAPTYRSLQIAFGPPDGFAATSAKWTHDSILLDRDDGEKDPTIQALGIGGQVYGARADLIIVDDAITLSNANQADTQIRWLTQEVVSRLPANGTILIVGTRVMPNDLYKLMREKFEGEWSYLAQPVTLEETGDPETTKTLWPRSTLKCGCKRICAKTDQMAADEKGEYPRWDGAHVAALRRGSLAGSWALTYMQADVSANSTFPEDAVNNCLNKQRMPGMLTGGYPGHRPMGMAGTYVLCSLDPALSGTCAAIAMAVDLTTGVRWILDLHNEAGMTPASIHALIKGWTDKYQPKEWRIEKNAMQGMLTQDQTLRNYLNARSCRMVEHFTGGNKWDDDYGVAGMANLFLPTLDDRPGLIDIPANAAQGGNASTAVLQLCSQLVAWRPRPAGEVVHKAKPGTTDLVMALWFANIRANEVVLGRIAQQGHVESKFYSRGDRKRQIVIDLNEMIDQQQRQLTGAL